MVKEIPGISDGIYKSTRPYRSWLVSGDLSYSAGGEHMVKWHTN